MATKAELQAQLATLRADLAKARALLSESESRSDAAPEPAAAPPEPQTGAAGAKIPSLQGAEQQLEHLVGEFRKELEQVSHDKPLLTALAAFMVGFMLARGK